ncbi:Phospholipase_D-nuclease N-terminal [Palleronia salina]|uniref:Phospholipase_D-nuclease N-terminal n=2 Tax=Palleronia TaxID=315422 RepID=A0A1M6JAP8_9RHOB|nr:MULTISPECIES: PLD nuclease N-terminal domain-containing protein [Palleronia]SEN95813.1 Phospholipase_D-nuclease N-terminal [Palleronia pelagia]SHJ43744.1 Phospholipase_D-nuclease N-terminal [Palleronia salina]
MEYGILGLIVLIADIYALYNIITSGASTLGKIIWCLVVLILPVLGFIAWLIAGPRGGTARV